MWTDTGIFLTTGQEVAITATGTVNTVNAEDERYVSGPDGLPSDAFPDSEHFRSNVLQGVRHGALILRIGDAPCRDAGYSPPETQGPSGPSERENQSQECQLVGSGISGTVDGDGNLFLGINDAAVANNDGEFEVTVTVG